MNKSKERMYAESVADQNFELLVDETRKLLADDSQAFVKLNKLVHMNNTEAVDRLDLMNKATRRWMMAMLIPYARAGFSKATFAMEDKYTEVDDGSSE